MDITYVIIKAANKHKSILSGGEIKTMKKKLISILAACMLAVTLTACGGTEESKAPLEVQQSGYMVEDGFLYYGVKIHNPNEDYAVEFPTLRITAKDAEGNVINTEDQVFGYIAAGDTIGYGFLGMEVSAQPSSVDFEMVTNTEDYVDGSLYDKPQLKATDYKMTKDEFGGSTIAGNIVNDGADMDTVAVTVLFKDAEGNIAWGESTFVDHVKTGTTPFSLDIYSGKTTDDYEIWVTPW